MTDLSTTSSDIHPVQDPQGIVIAGPARFTVISDTLVRMEYSESGAFTDSPTFLVRNRDVGDVDIDVSTDSGWLLLITKQFKLRYKLGLPFAEDTLEITWSDSSWRFGQKDDLNLGGTNWSLDAAGHEDWFPNLYDRDGDDFHPGLLSRNGYCLVDDSRGAIWDAESQWVKPRPDDPNRKDLYFFIYGSNHKHFLSEYISLTGPVPMLPKWVFGSWYSRYHPYRDEELKQIVLTYRTKGIPLDVLVIDMDWHLWGWVGYDWNRECFPDPEEFLKWCHDIGLRISLNDHTPEVHGKYVLPVEDSHYQPIVERLGLLSGEPVQLNFEYRDHWNAFKEIVIDPLLDQGTDLWWLDYKGTKAQPVPIVNPRTWLSKLCYDAVEERKNERAISFTRYGDLGAHRYPIGFSGDANSQWNVLDFEVPFTSHAVNVVFPYWSHDIGGFHGMWLDPEMFVRWVQFGCFSPLMRLHSSKDENGEGGHRFPWEYGDDVEDIIREFYKLRYRLMPYIYTCSRITHETAVPLCRPMYLEYPDQETAYDPRFRGQYMFGPSMLAAPITHPGTDHIAEKKVYLPEGLWYDFFTERTVIGPGIATVRSMIHDMPLFVKAGSIIPMQPDMQHVDEKPVDMLVLHIYAGADGSFALYEDDGVSLEYKNNAYSSTDIVYSEDNFCANLTISPTEGSYAGQLPSRRYEIHFHGLDIPRRVLLNGSPMVEVAEGDAEGWHACHGSIRVRLDSISIRRQIEIIIEPNHQEA